MYHQVTAKKAAIVANEESMRLLLDAPEGHEHPLGEPSPRSSLTLTHGNPNPNPNPKPWKP